MSIVIMLSAWFYYYLENNSEKHVNVEVTDLWIKVQKVDNTIAADIRSILPNFIEENEKQEISLSERIIALLKL